MSQNTNPYQNIREPAAAGQFYPVDKKELVQQIDDFLAMVPPKKSAGAILGLIVPHAGYIYSGQIAAYGFSELAGQNINTVILIGNSHHAYFEGAAIYDRGYFKTPLGEVEIDADLAQKIISENKKIKADLGAHTAEHSLEVEIPFLQQTLKDFKLVPILMSEVDLEGIKILVQAISRNIKDKNVLVVASSDMSHYPSYERANYADQKTCEAILTGKIEKLESALAKLENEQIIGAQTFLCAKEAVEVLMLLMRDLGGGDIKLLKYANSGDVAVAPYNKKQDKSQVVGYSAIAFYSQRFSPELNRQEQRRLLEITKQSVETYVKTGQSPVFLENVPAFNQKLGVFVTLKKQGQLRGCIGCFGSDDNLPLYQTASRMAIAAAVGDPRFMPVTADELASLSYEISVLSPLKKISDWRQIELGKHGVEVRKGSRSGVFLPQVAAETGWDLETFLGQLCFKKAGLDWDSWSGKDKDVELYTFTAQVFSD